MVVLILLPCRIESGENIVIYSPQRVILQFVHDQEMVWVTGDMSCSSALVEENMACWLVSDLKFSRGKRLFSGKLR